MTSAVLVKEGDVWVQEASTSGCLLESALPLAIGTVGVLELEFANERRVEWFRICRVHPARSGSRVRVFGAEFLPVPVGGGRSLRGAIGQLRPVGQVDGANGKPKGARRSSADAGNSTVEVEQRKVQAAKGSRAEAGKYVGSGQKVVNFRQRGSLAQGGSELAVLEGQGAQRVRESQKKERDR
jgi:hypothetical protein